MNLELLNLYAKDPDDMDLFQGAMKELIELVKAKAIVKVRILDRILCLLCQKQLTQNSCVVLQCEHKIHLNCLERMALTHSNDTMNPEFFRTPLSCTICNKEIRYQSIYSLLGKIRISQLQEKSNKKVLEQIEKQDKQQYLNRQAELEKKMYDCDVCGESVRLENMMTLDCNHRYCKGCVSAHIKSRVEEGIYDQIRCLSCDQVIDDQIIKFCMNQAEKERLENLRHQNLKAPGFKSVKCRGYLMRAGVQDQWVPLLPYKQFKDKKEIQEYQTQLEHLGIKLREGQKPNPATEYKECPLQVMYTQQEAKEVPNFQCRLCNLLMCSKGCESAHVDNTCQKYQEWRRLNGMNEAGIQQVIKRQSMARCPSCRMPILRSAGCNHIRCRCGYELCYKCSQPWNNNHYKEH